MSAGWVAGNVRAGALVRRRLGPDGARGLAGAGSLADAVQGLVRSPYGWGVRASAGLADAQRGVAETLLWHLRVLAGWLPGSGVGTARLLAGWFEIANVDEHLRSLAGRPAEPPFQLGALATSWPRLAGAGSAAELRAALAASPWGDPGGSTERDIQLGMRMRWAERVAAGVPAAGQWAAGAAALLVARERLGRGSPLPEGAAAAGGWLLGHRAMAAGSLPELAAAAPRAARWAVAGVRDPAGLWAAEVRWWRRLRTDGARMVAGVGTGFGPDRIVGTVALLATDAWLARAALAAAARGGPEGLEAFDAVA